MVRFYGFVIGGGLRISDNRRTFDLQNAEMD